MNSAGAGDASTSFARALAVAAFALLVTAVAYA